MSFDLHLTSHRNGKIFGLPFDEDSAELVLFPVPWDVTVSYRAGTARGPQCILDASPQLDLFRHRYQNAWEHGIYMRPIPENWFKKSKKLRSVAESIIATLEAGKPLSTRQLQEQDMINKACQELNDWVEIEIGNLLDAGKRVGLIGGDHSTPLGYYQALAKRYPSFGILQIDAHHDLREGYEGFRYSHASVMYNALEIPQVSRLVQVGIRDYSEPEALFVQQSNGRVRVFEDDSLRRDMFSGKSWQACVDEIINTLPEHVYVSFDIDGLDPSLCPHTGTPVAGGLSFAEAMYLIQTLEDKKKKVIGFDLVEVAPHPTNSQSDWDGNVGARVLYQMCLTTLSS